MELYQELLVHLLQQKTIHVQFDNFEMNTTELVEGTCYKMLENIKHILEDETLEDEECFSQIEAIVSQFEQLGCAVDFRHDF